MFVFRRDQKDYIGPIAFSANRIGRAVHLEIQYENIRIQALKYLDGIFGVSSDPNDTESVFRFN